MMPTFLPALVLHRNQSHVRLKNMGSVAVLCRLAVDAEELA